MVARATVSRIVKPTDRRLEVRPRIIIQDFASTTGLTVTNSQTVVESSIEPFTGLTRLQTFQWNGTGSDLQINNTSQPLNDGEAIYVTKDTIIGVWGYLEMPTDSVAGCARDPNLVQSLTPQLEMRIGNTAVDLTNSMRVTRGYSYWGNGRFYLQFHMDSSINYGAGVHGFFDGLGTVTTSGTGYDHTQPLRGWKFYIKDLATSPGDMRNIKIHIECIEIAPRHVPCVVYGGDSLGQDWVDYAFSVFEDRNVPMYAATGMTTPASILAAAQAATMANGEPLVEFVNHTKNHYNYGTSEIPATNEPWLPNTLVTTANYCQPSVFNGKRYRCTTGGTTGATEPSWNLTGTTNDGTAVWTVQSSYPAVPRSIIDNDIRQVRNTFQSRGDTEAIHIFASPYNTHNGLLEEVLVELGYVMNRGSGAHAPAMPSRFGFPNPYRLRALNMSNTTLQYLKDQIDGAIRYGCAIFPFIESVTTGAPGAMDITQANLSAILDYAKQRREEGQILVLSTSEFASLYL